MGLPILVKFGEIIVIITWIKLDSFREAVTEAKDQLERYAADERLQALSAKVTLKRLILVYNGWQLVHHQEVLVAQEE
jgi:hypothetical protein